MPSPFSLDNVRFVCCNADCELSAGVQGLSFGALQARIDVFRPTEVLIPEPTPEVVDEEGTPCPSCSAADPPRDGTLLALSLQSKATVLASPIGSGGLRLWKFLKARGTAIGRIIHFDPTQPSTTPRFIKGSAIVTGQVLRTLPFDGEVLAFGNSDAFTGKKWDQATAVYGSPPAAPSPAAKAEPTYIRELQKDLILLGYFSRSRGSENAGVFGSNTLGAVLAFKQDLVQLYGVGVATSPANVEALDIVPEAFAKPIHYQEEFVAPARLVGAWSKHLGKGNGAPARLARLRSSLASLDKQRKASAFSSRLAKVSALAEQIRADLKSLPFRFVLETPSEPYAPFAPKRAGTLEDLQPLPAGTAPTHKTPREVMKDPAFRREGFNSRSQNRRTFSKNLGKAHGRAVGGLARAQEARDRILSMTPPADAAAEWASAQNELLAAVDLAQKVLSLVKFWLLNLSTQIGPWLDHVVKMGMVDRATAVYLKALREGAKIGPDNRPGYQLMQNPEDFGGADKGATFLRTACRARPTNVGRSKAETMPEIIALQFYANESGMKFAKRLPPYNLGTHDAKSTVVMMGVDMNSHRRGTFDPTNTLAGNWAVCRGWGVGQETEGDRSDFHGLRLHNGLPVLPATAKTVLHPPPFADKDASFSSVLERKVLARFNKRRGRRDCTFADAQREYYDCHSCLKRFDDFGLLGTGKQGRGGVLVPRGKSDFGNPDSTVGFFVDLERVTAFARAEGATEDLSRPEAYQQQFGFTPPASDEETLEVLRTNPTSGTGVSLQSRVAAVADARGTPRDVLLEKVRAHMDARRDLPCTWCHVRIRYAGSGEQAWGALLRMFKVVGKLETKEVVKKHILEASEIRRREADK